jgi:uridine kinase
MIGDQINIKEEYYQTSKQLIACMETHFAFSSKKKMVIAIGGESGSGKSVTAMCLQKELETRTSSMVIHQDDYFLFPPQTNHEQRLKNLAHVGTSEVNWKVLQHTIDAFLANEGSVWKPLVNYKNNSILSEIIYFNEINILIVEGTYAFNLQGIDVKIFMDRTYKQTIQQRRERGRELHSDFMDQVLEEEHKVIRPTRIISNIIVLEDYSVQLNNQHHE